MMSCEEFEDLSGAYALGALAADELRAAREHLASCDKHSEVAELQAVAVGLAGAAPEMAPPPGLKSRLMEAVRAEAPSTIRADEAPRRGFIDSIRDFFTRPGGGYALSGALAVVVAALVVWNVTLQSDDDTTAPSGQVVAQLSGEASGRVVVIPDQGLAVMEITDLPAIPADKVYQVWAISGGQPASVSAISMTVTGDLRTAMDFDPAGVDTIAITVEDAPGADQPTSDPIISGEL